jgi:N-acetylglutamate synthase-like GNAT family acetyltransferase
MPVWADIDPAEIKPLLPQLIVSRYERNPFRVRYSLVGTWIVQYAGADFTGSYLDELDFPSEVDTDWAELHRILVTEGRPIFVVSRFRSESGLERDYETVMLPIADPTGSTVERCLSMEDFPFGVEFMPDAHGIALAPKPAAPPAAPPAEIGRAVLRFEAISAADRDFRRCLEDAKLPTSDLAGSGKRYFRLTESGESRAYGGFEAQGTHAFLRSIVVVGRDRGHGYGRTLVNGLVAEARKLGLKDAYLLTTNAAPFFAALDFMPCGRESAPAEIAATEQFTDLCPSNAKLMRREIG